MAVGIGHDPDVEPARLRRARRIASQPRGDVPMSATAVRPLASSISCALRQRLRRASAGVSARDDLARPALIALSTNRPWDCRRIALDPPAGGSAVAAVTPAALIAALLATAAWPSTRPSHDRPVGDHGVEVGGGRESACRPTIPGSSRGRRSSRCRDWRRHRPCSRCCSVGERVRCRSRSSCSSSRSPRRRCTWPCASIRPGSSVRPPASMRTALAGVRVLHLGERLDDLAVVADQQRLEPLQLAVGADLDAVGVVRPACRRGRARRAARGEREQGLWSWRARHSIVWRAGEALGRAHR